MVVLVIVGLMATAVVLTAPDNDDLLDNQAERFATRLVRAREEAILSTRAVEVTVTAQGYGFVRQDFDDWQPLQAGPFGNQLWPAGMHPVFERGGEQAVFHFDPTGAATVEQLVLAYEGQRMRVAVDAAGEVEIDARAR